MERQVTIQGIEGCFHDAAAREYFKKNHPSDSVSVIPCSTFEQLFERLSDQKSLVGIVAIENTIAGALLQNHELLRKSRLTIVGEYKMRISHVICALPGATFDTITEVNSHPMALMQCEQFLHRHPGLKKAETFDTAGSAKMIAAENLTNHAAICGEYAARLYGLQILESGIETNHRNFTRFLILAHSDNSSELIPEKEQCNKASIVFTLPHTQGALSKVLTILSFYDMNLSKIQSMPIIGREWEYRFYIDLTFNSYSRYAQAIDAIIPLLNNFRSLGEYKSCQNEI